MAPDRNNGTTGRRRAAALAAATFLGLSMAVVAGTRSVTVALAASGDWGTYLHDPQRTSANLDEAALSPANAAQMVKLWSFHTGGPIASSATVIGGTAYFGSWDGNEYAVDVSTGTQRWKTFLGTTNVPGCTPPAAGVSSAAAVQGTVVYVGGGDSFWYALDAAQGTVLWRVFTGDNSATGGHYNWSSPLLANGFAYIGVASFGDCPLVPGQLLKVDLSTHQVVATFNSVPQGQVGGGIWTSPSLDPATNTVFVTTGSPGAAGQDGSQAIVALDATTLTVRSSWKIPPDQVVEDSDWSTTPILFTDAASDQLVASMNKNGFMYAFNRNQLSAGPVWQKLIANGGGCPTCGDGSVSSAAFANGVLYAAGGNTTIGGAGYMGSVRALDPATGNLTWEHPDAATVIAAVAYANGLVFAGAGASLEVLDAGSGSRLYSFATGGVIYGAPSVSNGRAFAGSVDGNLYAWGLPSTSPPPPPPDPNCPGGWTCQDVGAPQPAGSESVSGSAWTVTGSGTGLGGQADQLRVVTQAVTGDGQIQAGVAGAQQAPGSGAQAGLLIRQSPDPASPFYAVVVTPQGAIVLDRATSGSGVAVAGTQTSTAPVFLEIQRRGDVFQAATSADGTSYTLIPGSTVTLVLPSAVMAGVAVSSGLNGSVSTATFSGVAAGPPGPTPSPQPPASPCPAGWSCADVGNPALVGNQSLSGTTWTVQGAGADMWVNNDQFHFVWQSQPGDATVTARVISQAKTDPWAKAGVILRQSASDAASPYYGLLVTPGNGLAVQFRGIEGLPTQQPVLLPGAAPAFVRVARSGSTFTAYTSADGAAWTLVAGSSVTLGVSGPMLGGLAVTSHNVTTSSVVTYDNVAVVDGAPPPPNLCPTAWSCADIGGATPAGGQTLSGTTWTVQGGGGDIWATSDQFHFVSQPLVEDGTVSARVVAQGNTDPWAKAGVMLRQSADPASAYYAIELTPGNGIVVQFRASAGANAIWLASTPQSAPAFVRVGRSGSTFTAFTSIAGATWTAPGGSAISMSVSGSMLAGLAVTSHNTAAGSTVTFDSVAVTAGSIISCPGGWTCADVGGATPAGGQTVTGGTWTVQGGGGDIWGTSDQFHFASQPVTGDVTVSARVLSQANTDPWAKTGVMLRQTSDPGSAYYAIEVTPGNGLVVQDRPSAGVNAVMAASLPGTTPAFVRVARSGSTLTAYTSADGTTWTPVPGSSITLGLSDPIMGGLAVTSHNTTASSTATFDSVAVLAGAPPSPTGCPTGWACADVGGATPPGSQTLSGGAWTVQGGGGDIWGTSDQFHFVSQSLAGDGTLSARVSSQGATSPWAKAGVMLRQTAAATSAYYAIEVTPSNGIVVQFRPSAGANAVTQAGLPGTVPAFVRVARSGSTFTAYTSADGVTWTAVAGSAVTLGMSGSMLAGLAVTSHNTSAASAVTFDSVVVSTGAAATPARQSGSGPASGSRTSSPVPNATPARRASGSGPASGSRTSSPVPTPR